MSSTTQNTPKAAEYAERIGGLFAEISFGLANHTALIGLAAQRCKADCNTPDDVGALLHALDASKGDTYELVYNLQDSVKLLLERVKELESASEAQEQQRQWLKDLFGRLEREFVTGEVVERPRPKASKEVAHAE